MAKINETRSQQMVDDFPPQKRCEGVTFCYWHCDSNLDGYWYRNGRVSAEDLSAEASLDTAKTYFRNSFKEMTYRGVKPTESDEIPS